jgi:ankyrin repeat protein
MSTQMNSVLSAVISNDLAAVRGALATGTSVDARAGDGSTPLMHAVVHAPIEIVRALLELGADVNAKDERGWTPLHFAAQEQRLDVAQLLVQHGSLIDAQDVHGNTPLWRAVFNSRGRGEMIKYLLSRGADQGLKNKHGVSPEDLAKTIANYDVIQHLS